MEGFENLSSAFNVDNDESFTKEVEQVESDMMLIEAKKNDILKNDIAKVNGYQIYRIRVEGSLPDDWYQQLQAQKFELF